jgi:predicted metal-dependent phosphotriesterase family hydrolase
MEAPAPVRRVMTVLGPLEPERLGVTDAHNHVWIDLVPGGALNAPVLDREEPIRSELSAYRQAGGGAILDCQPGGCGRDGRRLLALARASGVHLVACTGLHRRRYYPADYDLWALSAEAVAERFSAELNLGLLETRVETQNLASLPEDIDSVVKLTSPPLEGAGSKRNLEFLMARSASKNSKPLVFSPFPAGRGAGGWAKPDSPTGSDPVSAPVRAGFVKVACEARLADTPQAALEGAAAAAAASGAALMVHTEKGAAAEEILPFFAARGVGAERLVLCHIDKRPDFGLHRELAQAGVLLEYDTFYRPQYDPEANLWPLIERMAVAGLDHRLALATDMAEAALWRALGGSAAPGLAGLLTIIRPRLISIGLEPVAVARMLGGNIAARISKP